MEKNESFSVGKREKRAEKGKTKGNSKKINEKKKQVPVFFFRSLCEIRKMPQHEKNNLDVIKWQY